jgi:hypothetical protein
MKTGMKVYYAAILLTLSTTLASYAAFIPGVNVISVSSEYASGRDQRRGTNVSGTIGLFGDIHTPDPTGNMWMTAATATNSGAFTNAFLTFDLGSTHTINRLKVWNYNGPTNGAASAAGVHTAAISYSADNITYTTNIASANFNAAPLSFTNYGQEIDMDGVSARYVRLNVQTIYSSTTTSNRVGLAKVQLVDDTVAPTVVLATRNFSANQVTVQFSESVLPSTATNIANYTILSGATIQSAAMGTYNDVVVLQTSQLDTNLAYTITVQNVRDADNIVSVATTNLAIGSELMAWLQADNGVTVDGSGFVSQWNDQSGNANHALNATNATQPTLTSGAINGLPAVHFDGLSQLLEIPFNLSLIANRDFTFYIVMSADSADPGVVQGPITMCSNNVAGHFDFQIARTTGKLSFLRGNREGFSSFAAATAISPGQYYLVSFVMRGTNATTYFNGSFNSRGAFTTGIFTVGNPVRLGVRMDAGTKFRGNIAETILIRGAISDPERLNLDTYFATKYALPIVTVAITQQPTSVTRLAGQRASFGVAAVAGSPTINYQWRKGGANISGATNSIYTTPLLTTGDSGASYQVVVSTPAGASVTSSSASLTVQANTQPPTLTSASRVAGSATDILLAYSAPMNAATTISIGNYSLNNGATVTSAVVGTSSNTVVLTTSGLSASNTYYVSVHNVSDAFNNTIAPVTQLVLPSNLALWLRADSGVVTDTPGSVNEWDDQSANTNNAFQFSQSGRLPALATGAISGFPAVRFDGASNYLDVPSSPTLAMNGDMTIYVVANFTDFTAAHEIMGKTLLNQPAPFDYYAQNGTTLRFYRGNGSGNGLVTGSKSISAGTPHLLSVTMQGTNVTQFLDSTLNVSASLSTPIADAGTPLKIGSRDDLFQFMKGDISEIIMFGSSISATERAAIDGYLGSKYFPISINQQPVDAAVVEGATASFSTGVSGLGQTYQWYDVTGGGFLAFPGQTSTNLVFTAQHNQDQHRYALVISAGLTSVTSSVVTLTVQSSAPVITSDVPAETLVYSGRSISFSVTAIGSAPLSYQWQKNGTNLTDTSTLTGSHSNILTIANAQATDAGTYQVIVANSIGTNNSALSALTVEGRPTFNSDGNGWKFNGGDSVANNVLMLTDGVGNEGRSAFFTYPLYIRAFSATFNYQDVSTAGADGTVFVLQNAAAGSAAVGTVGGGLGYGGMTPSFGIEFNIFANNTVGIALRTNGVTGKPYTPTTPVNIASGDLIAVTVQYANGFLQLSLLDTVTSSSFTTNLGIDLPAVLGGESAYIGFTGGSGATVANQQVSNFSYVPCATLSAQSTGGNVLLSWPTSIGGYNVQTRTDFNAATWQNSGAPVNVVNGQNQMLIAPAAGANFFQLVLP